MFLSRVVTDIICWLGNLFLNVKTLELSAIIFFSEQSLVIVCSVNIVYSDVPPTHI